MRVLHLLLLIVCYTTPRVLSQETSETLKGSKPLPFRIAKETTYITGPLTKEGLVDYETYLNQHFSKEVTPENNAAVCYLKAMGDGENFSPDRKFFAKLKEHLGKDLYAEDGPCLVEFGDVYTEKSTKSSDELGYSEWPENRVALKHPWKSDEHPIVKEWLDRNRRPLERVIAGTGMQKHYSPLVTIEEGNEIAFLVPSDSLLHHEFADQLRIRSNLHFGENRYDDATRDLLAIHRLARQTSPPCSIQGIRMKSLVSARAIQLNLVFASSSTVSADQMLSYVKQFDELEPLIKSEDGLWVERLLHLDSFQRACTTDPVNDSREQETWAMMGLTSVDKTGALYASTMLKKADCNEIMMEINSFYDRVDRALLHESYAKRRTALRELVDNYNQQDDSSVKAALSLFATPHMVSDRLTSKMLGDRAIAIEGAHELGTCAIALERLSLVGIALSAYERAKGQYPDALKKLVPDYLSRLPLDPFNDQPFVYRTADDSAVIYSVGPNLADDGGTRPRVRDPMTSFLFGPVTETDYDLLFKVKRNGSK